MMQAIRLSILVLVMSNYLMFSVNAQDDLNAFSNNINDCLFDGWRRGGNRVLTSGMECRGHELAGLCYGLNNEPNRRRTALFAVCYNKTSLIPEFTGHAVSPLCRAGAGGREVWRNEEGNFAPNPQSEFEADYDPTRQRTIIPNYNLVQNHFYARGHLTPNSAFGTDDERILTMVNTNIAPQWQLFNSENWAILERAVARYSAQSGRRVYVVTGTGGALLRDDDGQQVPIELNNRVLVPKYFWKAVCDPVARSSVVFVAQNPTGGEGDEQQGGCNLDVPVQPGGHEGGQLMTPSNGIIHCYGLNALRARREARFFKLPPFGDVCTPSVRGTFLDIYLRTWG